MHPQLCTSSQGRAYQILVLQLCLDKLETACRCLEEFVRHHDNLGGITLLKYTWQLCIIIQQFTKTMIYFLELHYVHFHTSDNIGFSEEVCKMSCQLACWRYQMRSTSERGMPLQVLSRAMALDPSLTLSKTQICLLAAAGTFWKEYVQLSVLFISPEWSICCVKHCLAGISECSREKKKQKKKTM